VCGYSKSLTLGDFRGILISSILSKVFEHCILERFYRYFVTSDKQFGFKRNSSCAHAIYTLRSVIDYYTKHGSTVNVCSLDISKAFDEMNLHSLLIKLMERQIPIKILCISENWFAISVTCIKWSDIFSDFSAWHVAFVKVQYCRHIFLHVLLIVWLIKYKQADLNAM